MRFASADELNRFVGEVRAELESAGFQHAAERFARIQSTAYRTNSEWLGVLGRAVSDARRDCALSAELDAKLQRIMNESRRAWPGL